MPFLAPKAREDLEYFEQVIDDEEVVLVRDPVRGTYFRFNPLQAGMLRMLDGVRTAEEITAVLSEQFEVEIPAAAAERFVVRARELMLLDITSYSVTPDAARKQLRKSLRKAGFRMRGASSKDRPRLLSPESMRFAEAFRQLELGNPRAAAGYLAEILEKNPANARAKQLYELVQTSYIKAAGGMTDFPTWVLFNPSRLLTWMSRTFGNFLFGWMGVIAMIVFLCIGVYGYTLVSFDRVAAGPLDIAMAVVTTTVAAMIHELGHGLACQHYGGNVTEIGITLFYYIKPAPYCDTSSSYLIQERRHKMIVQMAGTVASLLLLAVHALLLAVLHPDLAVYPGLALGLVLGSALVFVTLIPFLKFDGYYAICDYFGFPNMRDRSFKLTRAWLSKRLLGLDAPTEELPRRTRALLIAYALLSFGFTVWFIQFAYLQMLAPIIERFQGPGLLFAVVLTVYLLRKMMVRPIVDGIRTIWRERRRIFTRRRTAILVALATAVIGPWFLRWPVLVDASFEVLPLQRADVRAQISGSVGTILVREGDRVRAGDPIATLRNPELLAKIEMLEAEHEAANLRLARLRDGARPEELALARSKLAHAQSELRQTSRDATVAKRLAKESLGSQSSADTARGKVAASAGAAGAALGALSLLEAGTRPEELAVAEAELLRIASELEHLRADVERLTLRSPIDGVVAAPHLEEKLQAALEPGDLLAEIHDLSAMVAEISLSPRDPLAEIAVGDTVTLRPYGTPDYEIRVRVARFRELAKDVAGERTIVAVTAPFTFDHSITGLTGHARIYGTERSLAYAHLYLPARRLVSVRLWSMW